MDTSLSPPGSPRRPFATASPASSSPLPSPSSPGTGAAQGAPLQPPEGLTPRRTAAGPSEAPRGPAPASLPLQVPDRHHAERARPGGFAPSPREQIKQLPYYSEKPARATEQNLNCQLQFLDSPQPEVIACRHFAVAWLAQIEASGKPDYEVLGDDSRLPQHVGYAAQGMHRRLVENAPMLLEPPSQWGSFMAAQLAGMAASGGSHRRLFLVGSTTHAMAWELKVKHDAAGLRYVANVYDPNVTATHKRVASASLRSFEALQAAELFRDADLLASYFPGESEATIYCVPPEGMDCLPPLVPGGDPHRRVEGPVPPPTASVVCKLMFAGAAGSLRDLLPAFGQLAANDPARATAVLEGLSGEGAPALHGGMQYGLAHAIEAYGALLATLQPDPADHVRLLAARQPDGTPALFMAMQEGHTLAVEAYLRLLKAGGLPMDELIDLLVARAPDGYTGLAMAIQEGHPTTVTSYLDALAEQPGVDANGLRAVLCAPGPAGWPALGMGLMNGAPDALGTFVEWIAGREDLGPAVRIELLLATNLEGTPALVVAMEHDEAAENVRAFVSAVLASPLDDLHKVDVLRAGAAPGALLRHARGHGASQCLAAYRAAVVASRPAPAVELMLLSEVPRRRRS